MCRGHTSVATAGSMQGHGKFSTGAVSVHWVLLIPCPLSVFLPLSFSLCCVCVFIIRWLLACFPNPTLTFLSATEKLGIPPTGKQSKRPGRIPAPCTNPPGHSPCPIAKEENVRITGSMQAAGFQEPRGPLPPLAHFPGEGHKFLRVTVTCTSSPTFNQSKTTVFQTDQHKACCSPSKHSSQKAFPHTKNLQWKGCLTN